MGSGNTQTSKNHLIPYIHIMEIGNKYEAEKNDTDPIPVNEWIDLWHSDNLGQHATQPARVDEVEVSHLQGGLVVVQQDATLMEEVHSLAKKQNFTQ